MNRLPPAISEPLASLAAWGAAGLLLLAVLVPAAALAQGPQSVADLAEKLSPAVVNVSTSQKVEGQTGVPMPDLPPNSPFREFFDDLFKKQRPDQPPQMRNVSSLGSGFVVDPSGIIVTNNHVIEGADEIDVNFPDGTTLTAKLLGHDTKTDIALLKVTSDKPLPSVVLGDSDKLRVGDWVMAIGNPFGLGGSVTLGIVSARNRDINAGPYDDFIQTDAAINRGNSGGPLFNMDGEVVGINSAIISPTGGSIGIGFAIPTSAAKSVIAQLEQFGETRRGWLGVKIQPVTEDISNSLSLGSTHGALVADVTQAGPAEKAGLQPGDVITQFDGRPVKEMRDLPRMVADTPVGREVTVTLKRKGQEVNVKVTLGRLEEGEKLAAAQSGPESTPSAIVDVLGMKLAGLTPELKTRFKVADGVTGAVVIDVSSGSAAAEKRIEAGDVITEAGEKTVRGPQDVAQQASELTKQGKSTMLLLVSKSNRGGEMRFIALALKK